MNDVTIVAVANETEALNEVERLRDIYSNITLVGPVSRIEPQMPYLSGSWLIIATNAWMSFDPGRGHPPSFETTARTGNLG